MRGRASPTDEELARRARGGEGGAMVELYRRYVSEIHGYAYNQLGTVQDAEDVTSEVFLRLVGHIGTYRGESSFRTWLYAVARNQVRDHYRRGGRRPLTVELAPSRVAAPAAEPAPRAPSRTTALARQVLAALPPNYRRVVELRVLEGRSVRAAAAELGTTEGNVKVLLHRALRRAAALAEGMDENANDTPDP